MFSQWAQAPLVEVQCLVQSAFSMANLFLSPLCIKTGEVGGEILNCYRKMVQSMVTPTNHRRSQRKAPMARAPQLKYHQR